MFYVCGILLLISNHVYAQSQSLTYLAESLRTLYSSLNKPSQSNDTDMLLQELHGDQERDTAEIAERRALIQVIVKDMASSFPPTQFSAKKPFVYTAFSSWELEQEYETAKALIQKGYQHLEIYLVDNGYLEQDELPSTHEYALLQKQSAEYAALQSKLNKSDDPDTALTEEEWQQYGTLQPQWQKISHPHIQQKYKRFVELLKQQLPASATLVVSLETPLSYTQKIAKQPAHTIRPLFTAIRANGDVIKNNVSKANGLFIIPQSSEEPALVYFKPLFSAGLLYSKLAKKELPTPLQQVVTTLEKNKNNTLQTSEKALKSSLYTLQPVNSAQLAFSAIVHQAAQDTSKVYTLYTGLEKADTYKVYTGKEYKALDFAQLYKPLFWWSENDEPESVRLF